MGRDEEKEAKREKKEKSHHKEKSDNKDRDRHKDRHRDRDRDKDRERKEKHRSRDEASKPAKPEQVLADKLEVPPEARAAEAQPSKDGSGARKREREEPDTIERRPLNGDAREARDRVKRSPSQDRDQVPSTMAAPSAAQEGQQWEVKDSGNESSMSIQETNRYAYGQLHSSVWFANSDLSTGLKHF